MVFYELVLYFQPSNPFDDEAFSDDPVRIVDNHFNIATGKPDLLKAPASFPMALNRYTLCEMSLVWHIYGGNDFPDEIDKDTKSKNEFDSHVSIS